MRDNHVYSSWWDERAWEKERFVGHEINYIDSGEGSKFPQRLPIFPYDYEFW